MPRQTVLEIGGEGGLLALYGERNAGGEWVFWMQTNESAAYDALSVEDRAGLGSPVSAMKQAATLGEAVSLLDRYPWFRLFPIRVHPEFTDAIQAEVRKRGTERDQALWRERVAQLRPGTFED